MDMHAVRLVTMLLAAYGIGAFLQHVHESIEFDAGFEFIAGMGHVLAVIFGIICLVMLAAKGWMS